MEERGNKTIICSVLFLDIVEYSKKSVSGQITLKERFNAFLSDAIRDIPVTDRIILDTGDGAAISFLGDIEDALQVALNMRNSLLQEGMQQTPPLLVRMGINLGPVRLVKDINSQPNIVGDGINVAQRVMGFADVGQLLVSRSYYDAVSRLSQEYAGMFHYQGSRTDKHVREHEIYAIGYPGEFTQKQLKPAATQTLAAAPSFAPLTALLGAFKRASGMQRALYVSLLLLPFLAWGGYQFVKSYRPAAPAKQVVVRYYPEAEQGAGKKEGAPTVVSSAEAKKAAKETAAEPAAQEKRAAKPSPRKEVQAPAAELGIINISAQPWGEVYLDGKMQGISPPLVELQASVGKHEIEIRNATFPVYRQTVQVKAGEKTRVKHQFIN
ncbi:MAG TPA: adenylate/guanylate cyclase domain-containing protein [Gallionellaceae bacterium]|nr:adenylate/guanylate cyclase domain-containing protein [Gallionellaceae bacterium]